MVRMILAALAILLGATAAEAARQRVVIPPRPVQPIATVPLVAVPPIAVVYDLAIRSSCDPRVHLIGAGPGFDPKQPIVGNFLLPAIYTRCGYPVPKWLQPAMPAKP